MKFSFLRVLPLLVCSFVYGQNGGIWGVVMDEKDEGKIEFATVTLFDLPDSNLVGGNVTLEDGSFFLEEVPEGQYFLKVKFIGYKTVFVEDITITEENNYIELPSILLKSSNELDAVEVTGEASLFETRIDKKVFNAEKSMISQGRSALDLLRQVPTITVDQNDNIMLRGDGSVTVLIDGRPTALPANQLLKQMPASAVEKVEIITNPSAKYDPEGMSGIINVVLKRNDQKGINGNVSLSSGYGNFPKYSADLSLNYRNRKLNIYGNYSFYRQKHWSQDIQDTDAFYEDSSWVTLSTFERYENVSVTHSGGFGMDYFINDNNTFYLSGSGYTYTSPYLGYVDYTAYGGVSELLASSHRTMDIYSWGNGYSLNTGWQKNFEREGNTLDIDLNLNMSYSPETETYRQDFFDAGNELFDKYDQNTQKSLTFQTLLGKIDYVLPMKKSMVIETGFHFTGRGTNNRLLSESAGLDGEFTLDTDLTNEFDYLQNVFAGYFTFAKEFKKIGIKAGVRAEQTYTNGLLINTGEQHINDYFELFPSVHTSYSTENNSEFQLSYSKRINRPTFDDLNPFNGFWDIYTIERGNPLLQPEIIHVNEFNYLKYWEKFSISASLYYRIVTNLIRKNLTYDGVFTLIQKENLGSSRFSGGDISFSYVPIPGLRIMSATSIWNTSTKDVQLTEGERENYTGVFSSLYVVWNLDKGWSFETWGGYAPRMRVLQGIVYQNYNIGIAAGKRILNDRGNISIMVMDILKSRQFTFESEGLDDYRFYLKSTMESRAVFVTFTYEFGKFVEGKNRRDGGGSDASDDELQVPGIEE